MQVIERMKEHNISQLPLVDNGQPVGLITEVDLLNYMVLGKHRIGDPVGPLAGDSIFTVTPEASVEQLSERFAREKREAAAVVKESKLVGLLIKIDVIDFLAIRFKS